MSYLLRQGSFGGLSAGISGALEPACDARRRAEHSRVELYLNVNVRVVNVCKSVRDGRWELRDEGDL